MGFEGGFDEKVDVIDLIINVLREHEKKLDELVARMEEALATEGPSPPPQEQEAKVPAPPVGAAVTATLRRWTEFAERCTSAGLVAFDVDEGRFNVSAVVGGILYTYEEEIPDLEIRYRKEGEKAQIDAIDISSVGLVPAALRGRLDCGLELEKRDVDVELPDGGSVHKLVYYVDPLIAWSWLAYQLGVEEDSIVQGELKT